ncbi:MAG: hypothetical protein R2705_14670 [Ilumatobacteraceae bacterium]
MTELAERERTSCGWCGGVVRVAASGRGRPRRFCSQRCRQWAWVTARRSRELELTEGELVVTRAALDELRDQLFVMACAVEDVRRDLERSPTPTSEELNASLAWVMDAAAPLVDSVTPTPPSARQNRPNRSNRPERPERR